MPNYECMMLVEPTAVAREWEKVEQEITAVLQKHGAKSLLLAKWGDRKLAYPINKLSRGTYVLLYFESPTDAIRKIRNDFGLSETILRTLIQTHTGEIVASVAPPEEVRKPPMPYGKEAYSWQATTR